MTAARRLLLVLVVGALAALAGLGVAWSQQADDQPSATGTSRETAPSAGSPTADPTTPEPTMADSPTADPTTASPDPTPTPRPAPTPSPAPTVAPEPELVPGPALLSPGDAGDEVRELQARLRQIDWFNQDVTGTYGDVTREAVEGFQAKREIPVTGEVDQRTMDRLLSMTSEPTAAELTNQLASGNVPGPLDARCQTGRALCVDKTSRTLRWVVDGDVRLTVDVRFGSEEHPTREGAFSVFSKSRDHVSSLYDTSMPFAMFFSGGQAVHYSPDFAAHGYDGASHGCVNVRDYDAVAGLFDQVAVGDKVIVYRS
ncbi:L,D-transpeptidase family protein [Nocardioides rubriscoriae]|uniref:L,D-transpeptidase family protein n=1 Tax=Nocardioides rubriscoriae TaxID=642762 RepID=UPI0011DF1602|nr:L,D-transpeptidase family protein [Nocardioides rubriscoriae]